MFFLHFSIFPRSTPVVKSFCCHRRETQSRFWVAKVFFTSPIERFTMPPLTSEGQRVVEQLAQSSGFSPDSVTHMLVAVLHGNGSMAQFGHPEFGGNGQWMRGGMLMVGDMFNSNLKARVDSLCNDIANILGR